MEVSKILQIAAGAASVGGLALAVFLVLCRDIVRKNVFPNLTRQHAFQIIRLIIVLAFCASLAGLAAWVYIERAKMPAAVPTNPLVAPMPKMPSLTWERSKKRHDMLRLDTKHGPIFNLKISTAYTLSFVHFPAGETRTDQSNMTLVKPDLAPPYSVENDGSGVDFYFQDVQEDIRAFAKLVKQFREERPGTKTLLQYDLFIQAKYDAESGAQQTRAWVYQALLDGDTEFDAQAVQPTLISNDTFEQFAALKKSMRECGKFVVSPSFATRMHQPEPNMVEILKSGSGKCKKQA